MRKLIITIPIKKTIILCLSLTASACQQSNAVDIESRLLELHNETRQNGISCSSQPIVESLPLTWNETLARAALAHSEDMNKQQKITHANSHGESTAERVKDAGYQWYRYAENLAAGATGPEQVLELWLNSDQHCKNLSNPDYTEMGAAEVNGYWTAIYATPK